MQLKEALTSISTQEIIGHIENIIVRGVTYDSRKVKKDYIFVGIEGFKESGTNYINQAISNGAVAIIGQEKLPQKLPVPHIIVQDARETLAILANKIYQYPSRQLKMIGITGTNGKTTVTYLIESILKTTGHTVALIGTIEYRLGDKILPAPTTTPQASDLQEFLHDLVKENIEYVVMEVSSHALALKRTAGCEFDVAIFTNLTRDHLDFHKTMEDYLETKSQLFSDLGQKRYKTFPPVAIINLDDPHSEAILKKISEDIKIITYSIEKEASVRAQNLKLDLDLTSFELSLDGKKELIKMSLPGKHNVYNCLAAIAWAVSQGIDLEKIKQGLAKIKKVPGRFELVDCGQNFTVVVDYAHTDDALQNVLQVAKELNPHRIITVFGCGGDRDRSKRPLMGQVAATLSDYCIITSDNPRTEDPEKIVLDVEIGIKKINKDNYQIILDRYQAIEQALRMAGDKDLVLIAGKGHENYQIFKDKVIHFDDREVVGEILKKLAQCKERPKNGKNNHSRNSK